METDAKKTEKPLAGTDSALAESAGYAADKERMDWLEATRSHLNYATMYQDWYVQSLGQVTGNIGRGKTAREAIDAARHIAAGERLPPAQLKG